MMNRVSLPFLCRIYILLVLLAVIVMGPLPYLLLALALLLVVLFDTIRPQSPRLDIVLTTAILFVTPLALAPLLDRVSTLPQTAVSIIAVIPALPALYLLDVNLRRNARRTQAFMKIRRERHTTYTLVSLLLLALFIMLLSPVVNNPVLLFAGIALALYLLGMLTWILFTIPKLPLSTDITMKRVITGSTASIPMEITNKAPVKMRSLIVPADPWLQVAPPEHILNEGKTRLELSFTPPLAGQTIPKIQASIMDPRGFVQINQVLEPLELHIIPRAKYAGWLARKYLEQVGSGIISAAKIPPQAATKLKRGAEYLESRSYQPGDSLKDIDWKHSMKLSQLIVREYNEAGEQAVIIAVNLSVTDAEAADKLAFSLITAALTMARENIPTALAAYNHQGVILHRGITESLEMLRQALSLVEEITPVEFAERYLEPTDIAKIRRNINRLKNAESEPARRLLDILKFEHRSIEEMARNHPATIALSAVTREVPPPAMILLVSQLNHDAEALLVTAEKLSRRHFTTVPVYAM